ncbi:hypothetical protein ILYODFUR_027927, partial [Ilyodon furcidens]
MGGRRVCSSRRDFLNQFVSSSRTGPCSCSLLWRSLARAVSSANLISQRATLKTRHEEISTHAHQQLSSIFE